jgi:titin
MATIHRAAGVALLGILAACGGGGDDAPAVPPPAAPSGLTGAVVSATEVLVTWQDNATNESEYRVMRSVDGGAFAQLGGALAPNSVTKIDDGCVPGRTYQYRVDAVGPGGTAPSGTVTVPFLVAAAPSGVTATATSSTTIRVAWTSSAPDAVSFAVYRSADGVTFAPTPVGTGDAPATSHDDAGLAPSTTYHYRVTVANLVGESDPSPVASATTSAPAATPPAAPSGLAAGTPSYASVPLTWTDGSGNETGFKIWRNTSSSQSGWTLATTTAANATSTTVAGLDPLTPYYFWIAATNAVGDSAVVGPVSATTAQPPPAAPTGFGAAAVGTKLGYTGVRFSWTDASTNETGFRVYGMPYEIVLGCSYKGTWTQVASASANATSVTVNFDPRIYPEPPAGTKICFRMAAYNGSGSSYTSPIVFTMP